MNRYEAIYTLINGDDELRTTLNVQHVYRGNAPDDPPEDIFIVLRWGSTNRELPELLDGPQTLVVWAYQPTGSYTTVDRIIVRVKEILDVVGQDGFAVCRWLNDSGDLYDDMWSKATRNSTYTVV